MLDVLNSELTRCGKEITDFDHDSGRVFMAPVPGTSSDGHTVHSIPKMFTQNSRLFNHRTCFRYGTDTNKSPWHTWLFNRSTLRCFALAAWFLKAVFLAALVFGLLETGAGLLAQHKPA